MAGSLAEAGVHPDIEHLPASILDGLGDHEGDLDMAGLVASQVVENWQDDEWRNAFILALRQHIENQVVHHRAELQALYNRAVQTVHRDGRRAIVKAYIGDALNELVEKAEWDDRLHPRGARGRFTYANRQHQASLASAMLYSQGRMKGTDQQWEFAVLHGNGKVSHVKPEPGSLPKLQRNDRILRARQLSGPIHPFTGSDDTVHFAEALGANSAQAGSAGAVIHEMSRQGNIQYGPNSWFNRLESASETLHRATDGRGPVHLRVGLAMGKYVGKHGPEVSRVLGPHMLRLRYKYRGTEADASQWTQTARSGRQSTNKGVQEDIPAFREKLTRNLATAKEKGGLDAVPTAAQAKIMLKTGSTAPSHGYILNAQGKVTSQAHGYGDDHYVPFNLRKLHSLNGGSYVRSRAYGGPTTEDIALANMTGATGFNVISRSGIYRVNFTPRTNKSGTKKIGAWAKNTAGDANTVMVDRYGRLLDAIKAGRITDPETQQPTTLNGRGYELALQSLAKQFPYFIQNVEYEPASKVEELKGLRASEGDTDSGYVRPYYLKPSEAVQGYYDDLLGGHRSFDELDSHRLGRARVWAAQKADADRKARDAREAERSAQHRTPIRREGEAPTNLPYRDRNVWAATGGGEGVGTRPKAETERIGEKLSDDDLSAFVKWAKAVLDHADTGTHPNAAKAKALLHGVDNAAPGSKEYEDSVVHLQELQDSPDARAELEQLLEEVAPDHGTGLEKYNERPILRSQGETEESVRGTVRAETHAADFEQDDEHNEYLEFKQYQQLRRALDAKIKDTGDPNAKLKKPESQMLVDKWEAPDPDYNGMSLAKVWDTPDADYEGLPYWKHYENAYEEAKHIDRGGTVENFKPPHPIPEDATPNVARTPGAVQADERDMDESERRRRETDHDREQEAEKYADKMMRDLFGEQPPF